MSASTCGSAPCLAVREGQCSGVCLFATGLFSVTASSNLTFPLLAVCVAWHTPGLAECGGTLPGHPWASGRAVSACLVSGAG